MKKYMMILVSLFSVVILSSCDSKKEASPKRGDGVTWISSENEHRIVTNDSIVDCYDRVTYSGGNEKREPVRKAYGLVKSSQENCSEEKDFTTHTITYRYTEVKEYADGTIISRPVTKTVNAYLTVYSDGSKSLRPMEEIKTFWVRPIEIGDSVDFAFNVKTKNDEEHTLSSVRISKNDLKFHNSEASVW